VSAASPGRWEWRKFGDDFGVAEERFAALEPERVHESDEIYLLSAADDADTVKVRDELMDVKHLEHVDGDGLEQWLPVMKSGFPLPAADVESVLAALRSPAPVLERAEYTLDQLLDEVVRPRADLRAADVHKLRHRFTIGGCMAEWTDVRADDASTRTIAVETEDPARVIATVRDLGLESRPNTSYPRGLKALLGFGKA
jgi:exopolyphosphatase / guanosine-5'-triphosphate,3'-diphosphate pyrophosphatase